ncbi:MAG TPA: NEW3 domain-containing protein [Acidimicrobiia bacterium]|nr:NEW3 domain-containing protein [Acidimicrobiia bacterium]
MRRTLAILLMLAVWLGAASLPVLAQEEPAAEAPFAITTPYPGVAVEAGGQATFEIAVTAPDPVATSLRVGDLPAGWTATFRGGGFEIDGVTAGPTAPEVSLDLAVSADTPEGSYEVDVIAETQSASTSLTLQVRVSALAGGEVTLTPDVPGLRVPAGDTATFSVDLRNDTPADLEFELEASGPAGWTVTAEPSTEPQATTLQVDSGSTATINLEAVSPVRAEAGQYPIALKATSPESEVQAQVVVEVVGSFSIEMTTSDQRLSTEVSADGPTEVPLVITNTGTAAVQLLELSATPPRNWEVAFSEEVVPEIGAGETVTVTATITPSDDAVAGDYVVTFRANSEQASADVDIRTTVNPSTLWGFVGIVLIALTLAGLAWVFRRYGRR